MNPWNTLRPTCQISAWSVYTYTVVHLWWKTAILMQFQSPFPDQGHISHKRVDHHGLLYHVKFHSYLTCTVAHARRKTTKNSDILNQIFNFEGSCTHSFPDHGQNWQVSVNTWYAVPCQNSPWSLNTVATTWQKNRKFEQFCIYRGHRSERNLARQIRPTYVSNVVWSVLLCRSRWAKNSDFTVEAYF